MIRQELHNIDDIISIDDIRDHTKTQDVRRVTDDQLTLYRTTSLEVAELYTGLFLRGMLVVTQSIASTPYGRSWRRTTRITLDYPTADGILTFAGAHDAITPGVTHVAPGAVNVTIPVFHEALDISPCCNPCAQGAHNNNMTVTYRTGFVAPKDIPSGIILGCLKFIAWTVMHAGDEILSIRNVERSEASGILGTNDAAWASGAIEQWRMYRKHA